MTLSNLIAVAGMGFSLLAVVGIHHLLQMHNARHEIAADPFVQARHLRLVDPLYDQERAS